MVSFAEPVHDFAYNFVVAPVLIFDGVRMVGVLDALGRLGDGIEKHQHGSLRPLAHETGDDSRCTHQQLNADLPFLD